MRNAWTSFLLGVVDRLRSLLMDFDEDPLVEVSL